MNNRPITNSDKRVTSSGGLSTSFPKKKKYVRSRIRALVCFSRDFNNLGAWKLKASVAICIADSQGISCDRSELASGASVKYKTTGDGAQHREVSNGRNVSGRVLDMRPLEVCVKMA